MNTDQKILQVLQTMNQRLGNIEGDMSSLKTDVADLKISMVTLEQRQDKLENRLAEMAEDLAGVKDDLSEVKTTVIRMEHNHGLKIGALFDAWHSSEDKIKAHQGQIDDLEARRLGIVK